MRARWLLAQTPAQLNTCYQLRAYEFGGQTIKRPHQDDFDVRTLPDGSPQACVFEIKRYGMAVGTARLTLAAHPHYPEVHSEAAWLLSAGGDLARVVNAHTLRWQAAPVIGEIGCVGVSGGANRDGAVLREITRAIASEVQTRGIDLLIWVMTPQVRAEVNALGYAFRPLQEVHLNRHSPEVLRYLARHYDVFLPELVTRLPELAHDPNLVDDIDDETLRQLISGCADGAHLCWMEAQSFVAAATGEAVKVYA